MRRYLKPSWLVRAQVGAKRGKLKLLGELRGTKLELKEALGAPKEAPRDPKRGMGDDGGVFFFGWVAPPK